MRGRLPDPATTRVWSRDFSAARNLLDLNASEPASVTPKVRVSAPDSLPLVAPRIGDRMDATNRAQEPFSSGSISSRRDFYFIAQK
jgi:hypothetical protein